MKDAWQMLYRTQKWLQQYMQNVLANIATLDMKAQLWVQFLLYFPISSTFHPVIPTSGDHITRKRQHLFHASGRIHYVKLVHLYHLKMCTLQDGHGQGWIPFLYRGRLLHHPMQRQVLGWCLVWHDHRTGIGMHTNGFWWAHIRLLNYREHSG